MFWVGTTIEARSRGSRSSHSLAIQSLTARATAARHVLAEDELDTVEAIADRGRAPELVEHLRGQLRHIGRRDASLPLQSARTVIGARGG